VVLRCAPDLTARVRYTLDTLCMSLGVRTEYVDTPPGDGCPWLLYAPDTEMETSPPGMLHVLHVPSVWQMFRQSADVDRIHLLDGLALPLHEQRVSSAAHSGRIDFDLPANAFYFLCSWSERVAPPTPSGRRLHADSIYARLGVPQDIVDRYRQVLADRLVDCRRQVGAPAGELTPSWPDDRRFALVLSHDVDFVPSGVGDIAMQGLKTMARHAWRERKLLDAARSGWGLLKAAADRRDPYGCLPDLLREERARGVRSSFQVAVARRHPADVNYDIRVDAIRDYLHCITQAGFDLCLHGSYLSTHHAGAYETEVATLSDRMQRPKGSRQHYLSFDYDTLFRAQQSCGIEFDMSMGYPDQPGPRAGFSFPYFPYDLQADRPYTVLQISLGMMDVTLRSYLGLSAEQAKQRASDWAADLQAKGGCMSAVWHPIVFGGARDPGYDQVYWSLVENALDRQGWCTDGASVSDHWRSQARHYEGFLQ